jgi:PAS domain S-box-containing protein
VVDRSGRVVGGLLQGQRLVEVQAAALASVSDAVMITDREGVIVWVNEAFTQMSGYSAEETVGATPQLLNSGEHNKSYYRRLWGTILAGRRWRAEVVERHKDGSHYRVIQTITPIVDEAGVPSNFWVF